MPNKNISWSDDNRSIDELVHSWLTREDDDAWEAVHVLRLRGTRDVFDAALRLCDDENARRRELGVYVLGQLGTPQLPFIEESTDVLLEMLQRETDSSVLRAIGISIGDLHPHNSGVIDALVRLKDHPDAGIRQAVAYGLAGYQDDIAIKTIIELSTDQDNDVRDWAVHFGLDSLTGPDTPEIRQALLDRLSDEDDEVRNEALLGLAHKKDERVREPLLDELHKQLVLGSESNYAFEAVTEMPDPKFCPVLLKLKERDLCDTWLDEAIKKCKCLE